MGGMGSLFFVIVLTLAGVGVGIALVLFGRRARRVDDHPTCRRCRFDLFGLGERAAMCPECGAPLGRPRALRVGNRRPSVVLVTLGVLVVLGSIGVGGGLAAVRRGTDPNRYKPAWLLVREARAATAPTGDVYLKELTRRLHAGQLSAGRVRSVVAEALERQADPNASWSPAWGDFVDAAWITVHVTPEQRARYLMNGVELTLVTRPRAQQGRPLPMRLEGRPTRLSTNPSVQLEFELKELTIDGAAFPVTLNGACTFDAGGSTTQWSRMKGPIDAELGARTLTTRWQVTLAQESPQDPTGERMLTFTQPLRIIARDEPVIAMRTDAEWRERIRAGVVVERLAFDRDSRAFDVTIRMDDLPCVVISEMVLREASPRPGRAAREWSLGPASLYPGTGLRTSRWSQVPLVGPGPFDLESVDFVLRPRIADAEADPSIDHMWGEDVVFPGVPVKVEHP